MKRPQWHDYFMLMAKVVSMRSTCNSRPTGAVLVRDRQILATGYNGAMAGAQHCLDQKDINGRPYCHRRAIKAPEEGKYDYCQSVHAEANAIAQAAKQGASVEGTICYCTLAPCYVCLKLLANAGVKGIWYELDYESPDSERDEYWNRATVDSPILFVRKHVVEPGMIGEVHHRLLYPTSKRRLIEPKGKD